MTADKFVPARGPEGIRSTVSTDRARFEGELLAVRDDALLLLASAAASGGGTPAPQNASPMVRLIPFTAIASAQFHQLGSRFEIRGGRSPSPRVRERLRRVSRFPQGMSPAIEADLLKAHGQSAPAGVDR
jgi:hypothetical protein